MTNLIELIDKEIEEQSILKHRFYQLWNEGKLTINDLKGYSLEYLHLVKSVPTMVEQILNRNNDPKISPLINENMNEEKEHIKPWIKFAQALGNDESTIDTHEIAEKTKNAVELLENQMSNEFIKAVAAMYAYEKELPEISETKIQGLRKYYGIDSTDAIEYFNIHKEVDIHHAEVWRSILRNAEEKDINLIMESVTNSMNAQNLLLDSIYEKYIEKPQ